MRKEKEMMDLIIKTAQNDEKILGVVLTGSRTQPDVKKDIFMDYDITYFVNDVAWFWNNKDWFDIFGEPLIIQGSENQFDFNGDISENFIRMMQFTDGNRIDLTIFNIEKLDTYKPDYYDKILLDKNSYLKDVDFKKGNRYLLDKPTKHEFDCVVNEFYWVSLYVAKGLWRRELPYAKKCFEWYFREAFEKMLTWSAAEEIDYKKTIGKSGKYLQDYLSSDIWIDYQKTYVSGNYSDMWDGLFASIKLFEKISNDIAEKYGFSAREEKSKMIYEYINKVRNLPRNAQDI